jgi:hypothetical protein
VTCRALLIDLELDGDLSAQRGNTEWNLDLHLDVLAALGPT